MEVEKTLPPEWYTHYEARLTHVQEISHQFAEAKTKCKDGWIRPVSFIFPDLLLDSYNREQVPVQLIG